MGNFAVNEWPPNHCVGTTRTHVGHGK